MKLMDYEIFEKLPEGTKIVKKTQGYWYAAAIWDKEKGKYLYSNFSHGLVSTLDRLLKKIKADVKIGDGFKNTKEWL